MWNSRLIGEKVEVRLHAGHLEVWYGQKKVEDLPRLRGRNQHRVNYRHVIDWLVRKPGAFADYRYQADLFPGSLFRVAYDRLKSQYAGSADKQYLKILELAARESESLAEAAIGRLCDLDQAMSFEAVEALQRECQLRRQHRMERLLRESRLPVDKSLGAFDLKRLPGKVSAVVRTLMDGSFVDRKENVLAFGNPGSGKTHLLCAIGQELVRAGRTVYFRSTNLLVQELLLAKRYERGSVLITSNLPFSKWESIFKDAMTTAAAIDRLVHHSVILELNLPSYRVEQAKKSRAAAAPAEASAARK